MEHGPADRQKHFVNDEVAVKQGTLILPVHKLLGPATCITKLSEKGVPENIIMATSGHKSVESLKAYNRPTEVQARQRAAMLEFDYDKKVAVDEALALASPRELAQLEEPNTHLFVDGPRRKPSTSRTANEFCGS